MIEELAKAKTSVITVGEGRGFVIETDDPFRSRLVITASHCLPTDEDGRLLLPADATAHTHELTHKLLAPLGGEPSIWAACLFADPVSDLAILGSPDSQVYCKEAEAYDELMESATPVSIGEAHAEAFAEVPALVLPRWPVVLLHRGT